MGGSTSVLTNFKRIRFTKVRIPYEKYSLTGFQRCRADYLVKLWARRPYSVKFILFRVVKYRLANLRLSGNIYWALLLRLLLVMLLFTLCRIGFYLYNMSFFPDMSLGN